VVILGGLAYSSDFSLWVALVNNIPTLIGLMAMSGHRTRRLTLRRTWR
jgi:hypothetical protein